MQYPKCEYIQSHCVGSYHCHWVSDGSFTYRLSAKSVKLRMHMFVLGEKIAASHVGVWAYLDGQ